MQTMCPQQYAKQTNPSILTYNNFDFFAAKALITACTGFLHNTISKVYHMLGIIPRKYLYVFICMSPPKFTAFKNLAPDSAVF